MANTNIYVRNISILKKIFCNKEKSTISKFVLGINYVINYNYSILYIEINVQFKY